MSQRISLSLLVALLAAAPAAAKDVRTISIIVDLPGADAESVESRVTDVVESAVNVLSGVDNIRSESKEGRAVVWVDARDAAAARDAIADVLKRVRGQLPVGTDEPVILPARRSAILLVTITPTDNSLPAMESALRAAAFADDAAARLSRLPGVSGSLVSAVRPKRCIRLDPARLDKFQIAAADVLAAIQESEQHAGGGLTTNVALRVGQQDVADLLEVTIGTHNGAPVRLKDVATVELSQDAPPRRPGTTRPNPRDAVLAIGLSADADSAVVLPNITATLDKLAADRGRAVAWTPSLTGEARSGDVELAMERSREQWPLPPGMQFSPVRERGDWVLRPANAWAKTIGITGPDLAHLEDLWISCASKIHSDIDVVPGRGVPELKIEIDRARAADLGVAIMDVAGVLRAAAGGQPVGHASTTGSAMETVVRLSLDRAVPDAVGGLLLVQTGDIADRCAGTSLTV